MSAVQRAAQSIVVEVRRQFKEIPGIMEGKADPDYASVRLALHAGRPARDGRSGSARHRRSSWPPASSSGLPALSVCSAVCPSPALRWPCSCPTPAAPGTTRRSISRAATTAARAANSHKAAVVGDTVGDPFKDTSGPSLNILIKLCSTVSIVFSGLILAFHLI